MGICRFLNRRENGGNGGNGESTVAAFAAPFGCRSYSIRRDHKLPGKRTHHCILSHHIQASKKQIRMIPTPGDISNR